MRVLCIKEGEWQVVRRGLIKATRWPVYGEVLTASGSVDEYYFIDECGGFFNKKHFIPCADSDSEVAVNEKEEAYA